MNNTKSANRTNVFDSAVDLWLVVLMLLTPVASAAIGAYLLWIGKSGDAVTLFLIGAAAAAVTALFAVPCRYTILDDTLSIRAGILCYQVPLADIVDIRETSSLWSGPALSMYRVAVKTNRRTHLISPKDRIEFIRRLRKAAKGSPK